MWLKRPGISDALKAFAKPSSGEKNKHHRYGLQVLYKNVTLPLKGTNKTDENGADSTIRSKVNKIIKYNNN